LRNKLYGKKGDSLLQKAGQIDFIICRSFN